MAQKHDLALCWKIFGIIVLFERANNTCSTGTSGTQLRGSETAANNSVGGSNWEYMSSLYIWAPRRDDVNSQSLPAAGVAASLLIRLVHSTDLRKAAIEAIKMEHRHTGHLHEAVVSRSEINFVKMSGVSVFHLYWFVKHLAGLGRYSLPASTRRPQRGELAWMNQPKVTPIESQLGFGFPGTNAGCLLCLTIIIGTNYCDSFNYNFISRGKK